MPENTVCEQALPKYFRDSLTDISPDDIKAMGGRAVGIDIDNTCCFDSTARLFDGVEEWLKNMHTAGIPVIIITNTYGLRAKYLAKKMGGLPCIWNAHKPQTAPYEKAAEMLGIDVSSLVMIGDQLFTDVLGANRAGAVSVRVKYKKREVLLAMRFRLKRRKENRYLISKGLGDKI